MLKILNQNASLRFAKNLASILQAQDIVLFKGDLGTGKSTLIRAIIQALVGYEIDVPSPTFTLVQTYDTPQLLIWHFDLYRLGRPEEAEELNIEEAFYTGVSLIEWPERLGYLTPKDYLLIELKQGDTPNERHITLKPGRTWRDRIERLA